MDTRNRTTNPPQRLQKKLGKVGRRLIRRFQNDGRVPGTKVYFLNAYEAEPFYPLFEEAGVNIHATVEYDFEDVFAFDQWEFEKLIRLTGLKKEREPVHIEYMFYRVKLTAPFVPTKFIAGLLKEDLDKPEPSEEEFYFYNDGYQRNPRHLDIYAKIAVATLTPVINRRIVMCLRNGRSAVYEPDVDQGFTINIYSVPHGIENGARAIPAEVFGTKVPTKESAFDIKDFWVSKDGDTGLEIKDGEYVAGYLLPNALYIPHNLTDKDVAEEIELFAKILILAAALLEDPNAFEAQKKLAQEYLEKLKKEAFLTLVTKGIQERKRRHRDSLEEARANAREKLQEYFSAERYLFELENAALNTEAAKQAFITEFEKLRDGKVAHIIGIEFDHTCPETITLLTEDMQVRHPETNQLHNLGKYRVQLSLTSAQVHAFNENPRGRIHSPHVFDDEGRVCLGNIESEIAAYIAHYEIESAATLMVAFLQSVRDEPSYFNRLLHFPVVEEADKTN
jgi:hypothetical protein